MNTQICYLRSNGFRVRVNHYRAFERKNGTIITAPVYFKKDKSLKLLTSGGFTHISVFKDKKLIDESVAYCNPVDTYCYNAATAEAVKKLKSPQLNWD